MLASSPSPASGSADPNMSGFLRTIPTPFSKCFLCLALALLVCISWSCACNFTHTHAQYTQVENKNGEQENIKTANALAKTHVEVAMISLSDNVNMMEKASHWKVFESHASFLYMMRSRVAGCLKSWNTKHNRYWSKSEGDDEVLHHQMLGMMFFTTTKDSLKSTGWVVNKLIPDKHKKRLTAVM